jgi:lysine-N-methylase
VVTAQQFHPDFLREFACKCGDCRRTCCSNDWVISLTKEEFQADRSKTLGAECHALANKYLRRTPSGTGDKEYAHCLIREDGFCALLTEDKLCAWQKLRGESVGAVCNEFPKMHILFLEDEYVAPTVACEAVAELLLEKTDPLRLVSERISHGRNHFSAKINQKDIDRRPLLRLYPELIRWGLAILQDRRFPLDDRFVLLANAMCLIDWMERNSRVGELPDAMDKFLHTENLQQISHQYDKYSIGPKALLAVNVNAFVRCINLSRYQAKARLVLDGLGLEVVETGEDGRVQCRRKPVDGEKYRKRKENLAGFMRQKEIFLEHVMVCEYLRSMMPVTEPSVWDNFKFFNVCYALHKGILIGSFDSSPSDAEMADAIVLIHRMFIHNYEANYLTLERLKEIQLTDLTSMVALAKG